jgi:tyrosyl-tRNA synthetase
MGKTEKGAVWLDSNKTSPYDLFQYLRNIDDEDVNNVMKLLTFLPVEEIDELTKEGGSSLNKAKEILAYEFTKLIHGEQESNKALDAAKSLFGTGVDMTNAPTIVILREEFDSGINIIDFMTSSKVVPTKSEGRRLIEQGGISIDDFRVDKYTTQINSFDFTKGYVLLKKGKKNFYKVVIE